MADFSITLNKGEFDRLENELHRLNSVKFEAVKRKQLTDMLNRARAPGGTPYKTGELRKSSSTDFTTEEVGYTKDYAPHVEFGHRTRGGGWVQGQHYLQKNVENQRPIYESDLKKAIRGER